MKMPIKIKKIKIKTCIIGMAIVLLLTTGLIVCGIAKPYCITVDGAEVAQVAGESNAEKVVEEVMSEYTPEGAQVQSIAVDKEIKIKPGNITGLFSSKTMSSKEAVKTILEANETEDPLFTVTITGSTSTVEKFEPDPEYVKDENMFAGDTRKEDKGEKGSKLITSNVICVNGQITETETVDSTVVDEGVSSIIYKGTKGLPEGEDWKTYDGAPIFENGEDLVEYGKKFLGNPYVKGGSSLTNGTDCVGFVRALYRHYGVNLPATLGSVGRKIPYSQARAGDILIFKGHVAIYMGDGKMIHAANPKYDICISNVHSGIRQVRRVIK